MKEEMIKTRALTKRFGPLVAVDALDLRVQEGEIFGFLGPNGAGKSTTMRMLCGILDPTSGEGWVAGHDICRESEAVKRAIGYVPQRFGLYPYLTVEENIDFYGAIYEIPRKPLQERKGEVLQMTGLQEKKRDLAGHLSGGLQQRLAFGCSILHRPQILFLDEPTAGIDPIARIEIWRLITELSFQGMTVFVSTHYIEEAEHCHRVGLMSQGKLIACDNARNLKSLLKGRFMSIGCRPLVEALDLLRQHENVLSVTAFGDRIHVAMKKPNGSSVREFLENKKITIYEAEQIEPSLEEVFISMVSHHKNGY